MSACEELAAVLAGLHMGDAVSLARYVLTELGRSLRPVIVVLAGWGNARLAPHERSMVLVDAESGAEAEPVVVDRATGRRIDGADFVFTAGPAASKPFRDRYQGRPEPSGSAIPTRGYQPQTKT
jgi:hypothetical protein